MSYATAVTWIFNFVRLYLPVPTHPRADAARAGRRLYVPAPPLRLHAAGRFRLVCRLCVASSARFSLLGRPLMRPPRAGNAMGTVLVFCESFPWLAAVTSSCRSSDLVRLQSSCPRPRASRSKSSTRSSASPPRVTLHTTSPASGACEPRLASFARLRLTRSPLSLTRSYNFRKYILRQRLPPREPLYAWEGAKA